jgi:hypothetical protein
VFKVVRVFRVIKEQSAISREHKVVKALRVFKVVRVFRVIKEQSAISRELVDLMEFKVL